MIVKLKSPRASFPRIFVPEQFQGAGDAAYSIKLVVKPGSEDDKAIRAAIETVAKEKFPKKWELMLKEFCMDKKAYPYMDGNRVDWNGAADNWILTARRAEKNGAPMVQDAEGRQLTKDAGDIYAGCYVYASVEFYAQDGTSKGIRCTLRAVRFKADGDSFGGGSKVNDDELDDLIGATADDLA